MYNKQQEKERLNGLIGLFIAACVALAVVSIYKAVNSEVIVEGPFLLQGSQARQAARQAHIERAVDCAVHGGDSCECQ